MSGIYFGSIPGVAEIDAGIENSTISLSLKQIGRSIVGTWHIVDSIESAGQMDGVFEPSAGADGFGTLTLRIRSGDWDVKIDGMVTAIDGSRFKGEAGDCGFHEVCTNLTLSRGPVTFTRPD